MIPSLLIALLVACAPSESFGPDDQLVPGDDDTAAAIVLPSFWIEVEPSDGDGPEVLPQRFGPYLDGSGFLLELSPAVRIAGTIAATSLSGWALAPLPTVEGPVAASLLFRDDVTGSTFPARADDDGAYELLLVPGAYTLQVRPDSPRATTLDEPVQAFGDGRIDVHLDVGAPLWGRVRDDVGTPVPGATVSAVRADGLDTVDTTTDEGGWYELRVEPGAWRVVTSEPAGERRPTLLGDWVEVDAAGLRQDVDWGPAERSMLQLRVVNGAAAARDVTVRLSSTSLTGYPLGQATYAVETRTDSKGLVEARLPDGVYAVEIVPGSGVPLSPTRVDDVLLAGDLDLGDVAPPGFVEAELWVEEAGAVPLPGASVLCAEVVGQKRSWEAEAGADGVARLDLPQTTLRCLVEPPAGRDDLASTRITVQGAADLGSVALGPGEVVAGRVVIADRDGASPAAFAVVRLVDGDGAPLATALAGDDGAFSVRVDAR